LTDAEILYAIIVIAKVIFLAGLLVSLRRLSRWIYDHRF